MGTFIRSMMRRYREWRDLRRLQAEIHYRQQVREQMYKYRTR